MMMEPCALTDCVLGVPLVRAAMNAKLLHATSMQAQGFSCFCWTTNSPHASLTARLACAGRHNCEGKQHCLRQVSPMPKDKFCGKFSNNMVQQQQKEQQHGQHKMKLR
jgi:hypothetical protein